MKKPKSPRTADQSDRDMGQRIRIRRVEQKLSQAELGDKLGISFQQVQKYEKGVNRISAPRLAKLAAVLQTTTDYFYGTPGKAGKAQREVESLIFEDSPYAIRLLRAYNAMDEHVARSFVATAEAIVRSQAA